jgi:eukaryotic-like serine/threonine-protein kinase
MALVESDRSLLFGILALQNGLIEQPDLIAAFQSWSKKRSSPMAQVLVERGALTEADRTMLDGLVRRHVEKHGGEPERSVARAAAPLTFVEDRLRAASEAIDDEGAPARVSLASNGGSLARGNLTSGADPDFDPEKSVDWSFTLGQTTSDGGRFRLLRHHARGGIGVVFVALDSELHREVALKQIQPQHADDPTSRARFLIEAEVTGRLEHPGVVPVYGLGTNDQGQPYYAMRFVRGRSLKEAIESFHQADLQPRRDPAERTLALRQLLGRFIDVCHAIAYAHSRGVLHRDLKPANILLGPYGETLVVDWGLAKVVGRDDPTPQPAAEMTLRPSSPAGSSETMAGTAIGTPMYMSPEQAEGRLAQIGPSSDIYGLGGTLYTLVTGKPALENLDVDEILARVRRGEIPPPRQVNIRVPAALEAVILKAMAHRASDRYPSAQALAEEVERWLADEPVSVLREPPWERARRWMRRRRTTVAAIAATVLASTVGLAAVLLVQTRANHSLQSANRDLAAANERASNANRDLLAANSRERARFDLSLEAIKTFHGGVSEDLMLKEKQFEGLRTKLLHGATDFYHRLEDLLKDQADQRSRGALGQAYHDIGELTAKIGSQTEALSALKRGLELQLALSTEPDADAATKLRASQSWVAVGDLQEATGASSEALESYRQASEILDRLARSDPESATYRAAVANCLHGIARSQYHSGHAAESLASHEQVRLIRQDLADRHASDTQFQSDLAVTYHEIGAIQRAGGDRADALVSYERALAIRKKLAQADPAVTQFQSDLAQSFNDIGFLQQESGHLAQALESLEPARAILQKLADLNPAVTLFEGDLAQNHQVIGSIQDQTGRRVEALASYERARSILQKLTDLNPTLTVFQNRLAMSHSYLGLARQRGGRPMEAAAEFGRAVAIMERLSIVQPDGYNLYNLACFRSLLSGIGAEPGSGISPEEVGRLAEQAVAALRQAVAAGSRDVAFMRRDTDLDPIRSRPDFQMLILDLDFPREPFAR